MGAFGFMTLVAGCFSLLCSFGYEMADRGLTREEERSATALFFGGLLGIVAGLALMGAGLYRFFHGL